MAQVILHYCDGQDNLETFITPVFSVEDLTQKEYNKTVREHIHQLLTQICTGKGYEVEFSNNRHFNRKKNIPELIEEITSHSPEGIEPSFSWFIFKNQKGYYCSPLNLQDLVEEYLSEGDILGAFDDWVNNTRTTLERRLDAADIPVGTTISFPEELEYYTEFPMGIPEKAKKHLKHSPYSPSSTEYTGLI